MAPFVSASVLDSKAGILMDVDSDNDPLVQSWQTIQPGIDNILLAMTLTQTVDEGAMDLDRDSALEAELMTGLSEICNQLANALHGSVQGNVGAHLITSQILDNTHIGTGKQGPLDSLYSGSTIHQLLLELNIELQTTFGSMQLTVKPSQCAATWFQLSTCAIQFGHASHPSDSNLSQVIYHIGFKGDSNIGYAFWPEHALHFF
ncbi:hypothetical protein LPJ66_005792 [Kickxella alabastrina]|uniref:Uncharacterized protein n=1 Tax=Kickxella alabastrina TaxID=61397 RepID=A0ACC1IE57_9FUNG|nr:hypothetical protein LPJ66_005792 [Kickxella alabastrina]